MFNIFKRNKDKKSDDSYHLSYDNLAIPEIHTRKKTEAAESNTPHDTNADDSHKASVVYDGVAIPEVHIKEKKH